MKQGILSILLFISLTMPAVAGVYMENFNDGDFRGWQPVGLIKDCWKVVDSELCGDTDQLWSPELVLNLGRGNWNNYTVECDAKFIETHDKYKHLDDVHRIELGTRKLAGIEGNIDETVLDGDK